MKDYVKTETRDPRRAIRKNLLGVKLLQNTIPTGYPYLEWHVVTVTTAGSFIHEFAGEGLE